MIDLKRNDLVIIIGDLNEDDPVAAEHLNDHAFVQDIFYDHAILKFLNGETQKVQLKNLRKVE